MLLRYIPLALRYFVRWVVESCLSQAFFDAIMLQETLEKRGHEVDAIYQLSTLVNAGLDRKIVAVVMELIEYGVNPESIADGMHFCVSL